MIRDVHLNFHKMDRIFQIFINERLKDIGLSSGLFYYILELSHKDGLTLSELNQLVFFDKANTSRAVAKLETLGYIKREANPQDMRSAKVYITDLGAEAAKRINEIFIEWRDLLSKGLDDNQKELAYLISQKLYDNAYECYLQMESTRH